jgi:hypothetical protein
MIGLVTCTGLVSGLFIFGPQRGHTQNNSTIPYDEPCKGSG